MFGTGLWIGIALIVGFYLGVTLMSLLSIARDNERAEPESFQLDADRRSGTESVARVPAVARRS